MYTLLSAVLLSFIIYKVTKWCSKLVGLYQNTKFYQIPGRKRSTFYNFMTADAINHPSERITRSKYFLRFKEKIIRVVWFGEPYIFLFDADAINQILSTKQGIYQSKCAFPPAAKLFFGSTSMILSQGEEHRRHRIVGSACFKSSNLKHFIDPVIRCTNNLVQIWNQNCEAYNGVFTNTVSTDLSYLTLYIIMQVGLGIQESCHRKPSKLSQLYRTVLEIPPGTDYKSSLRLFIENYAFLPTWQSIKKFIQLKQLHRRIDDIITERYESLKDASTSSNAEHHMKPYLDYLCYAISDGSMRKDEVRHELMTILLAGHETTSTSILWALMLLSQSPDIQQAARVESQTLLQYTDGGNIALENVEKLKLIHAIIYETLRLYPVIDCTGRVNSTADELLGYNIPPNVNVVVDIMSMHRDPDVWTDPDSFKPQRFLEPVDTIPWNSWMPFGQGPHKCLGHKFALMELTTVLAMLLQRFQFSLANDSQAFEVMNVNITIKPKPDIIFKVSPVISKNSGFL